MGTAEALAGVWVFGDYRNYFRNRVTLQLIAKGKELAGRLGCQVAVLVLGEKVHQYAMEYVAHGADLILAADHPELREYQVETYTPVIARWVEAFTPDIFITGGTSFGREFFPRLAKRLRTGLSADCMALDLDPESGLLLQTTPAFGGELLADVVTQSHRPQMATVHPGVFHELPHNSELVGRIIYPDIGPIPSSRTRLIRSRPIPAKRTGLESANVVVVGGRGLQNKAQFDLLFEVAALLEGEVGATRPMVRVGLAEEERLIGQTGKNVKPRLLISVGTSGALQYTVGIQGAEVIIAINRDPDAPIFKMADLGLVGDARTLLPMFIEEIRKRL
jgi:electron transfer flavoprotein alpha subunit